MTPLVGGGDEGKGGEGVEALGGWVSFVRLASVVGGGGVLSRDASVGGLRRVPK